MAAPCSPAAVAIDCVQLFSRMVKSRDTPDRDMIAEHREREDDRGEADADGDAGLAGDVERGGRENAAEEEPGDGRADRELRHVAAVHVLEPPRVLLRAGSRSRSARRSGA